MYIYIYIYIYIYVLLHRASMQPRRRSQGLPYPFMDFKDAVFTFLRIILILFGKFKV